MNGQQPSGGGTPVDWSILAGQPATPESLVALTDVDPAAMTGAALVDAIVASEKALSLLAGMQMRLLTAFAVPFVAGDPMPLAAVLARKSCITGDDDPDQVAQFVPAAAASLAATEVAAALRIPCRTAGIRVADAETMTGVLAPTLEALEQGVLDRVKARVIADHWQPLTPEQTQDLQDLVLPGAGKLTTSELREVTGQAVIIVDPDGAEHRHQEATARRNLALQTDPDGMATLRAHLPADGAVKIFQVSDLLATSTAGTTGDTRGIGARRVDALVDIADHLLTHGFVDLTDYLGQELPDHGPPTPRARRVNTDTAETDATSTACTETASTGASPSTETASTDPANSATENGDADETVNDPTKTGDSVDQPADAGVENTAAHPAYTAAGAADTSAGASDVAADPADADVPPDEPAQRSDRTAKPDSATSDATETGADNPASGPVKTAGADQPAAPAKKPRKPAARVFTRQGRRPHLSVTIGISTLAGLDNLPGVLAGFGAIPASLARSIAASAATINALITDPDTGIATAAGALTYRPTQELRDQIAALVDVCQFPSCRQPVWRCDMDHRDRFDHQHPDQGGPTTARNTGPFCRRHHLIKHHSEWRVRIDPNRTVLEFTSPTGHTYEKQGRRAAAPGLWVSTAGTQVAERLDDITNPPTTLIHHDDDEPGPTSHIEDLLAAILVRHHLNTRTVEIDYDEPETGWHAYTEEPPPF